MNTLLFLSKLMGIARRGVLKELEVCDFDKTWSACQCRAYEIVKWELNKLILCDMSAFEQEYSHVCL